MFQNLPKSNACVDVQVAPVVDASSSQSRTDVLVILLSAVLLLTGLQWLALQPKVKPSVSCTACPGLLPHSFCWHLQLTASASAGAAGTARRHWSGLHAAWLAGGCSARAAVVSNLITYNAAILKAPCPLSGK